RYLGMFCQGSRLGYARRPCVLAGQITAGVLRSLAREVRMRKKGPPRLTQLWHTLCHVLRRRRARALNLALSFVVLSIATAVSISEQHDPARLNLADFAVGRVAERNVVSPVFLSLTDELATQRQYARRKKEIPAVFERRLDLEQAEVRAYQAFCHALQKARVGMALDTSSDGGGGAADYEEERSLHAAHDRASAHVHLLQQKFVHFSRQTLRSLLQLDDDTFESLLRVGTQVLARIFAQGVVQLSDHALKDFNPHTITISEERPFHAPSDMSAPVASQASAGDLPSASVPLSPDASADEAENAAGDVFSRTQAIETLIRSDQLAARVHALASDFGLTSQAALLFSSLGPFLRPNIVFDPIQSERHVRNALARLRPVTLSIHPNEIIVRRGFIVSATDYARLQALAHSKLSVDRSLLVSSLLLLAFLYLLAFFLFSKRMAHPPLKLRVELLILYTSVAGYLCTLFLSKIAALPAPLDSIPFQPTALCIMLVTALVSHRSAVTSSFLIAFAVLIASQFHTEPTLFALLSGVSASACMRVMSSRLDIVKSSCVLAVAQPFLAATLMFAFPHAYTDAIFLLTGVAISGFLNGILVLGLLPILEALTNAPTVFRLMELSDLNVPIMKKMLLTVSGTYNHTMMVATLAENACRSIGAHSLLARVGAYYHDIGKMENGEYFVENQTGDSKHLDLNPRLSATVIRSHVKLGVEKAHQLRLPQEVIDIIAEHHGNSLITYFYEKARELDPNVDREDFTYPGVPPRTKESAVVMLADVVEASCRTLNKPTIPRLGKFIDKVVQQKIETHQLDNSDLTFRDVQVVKECFVRILAGYYHSRIEYPHQRDSDQQQLVSVAQGSYKE
ncbi:HD family phosphohydrolase, partial [Treponema pallidum]